MASQHRRLVTHGAPQEPRTASPTSRTMPHITPSTRVHLCFLLLFPSGQAFSPPYEQHNTRQHTGLIHGEGSRPHCGHHSCVSCLHTTKKLPKKTYQMKRMLLRPSLIQRHQSKNCAKGLNTWQNTSRAWENYSQQHETCWVFHVLAIGPRLAGQAQVASSPAVLPWPIQEVRS